MQQHFGINGKEYFDMNQLLTLIIFSIYKAYVVANNINNKKNYKYILMFKKTNSLYIPSKRYFGEYISTSRTRHMYHMLL